jgi:hypothetical protein
MAVAWEANGKPEADKSVGELFSDLSDELRRLARAEAKLALIEARRKATRAGVGAGTLGVAALLGACGVGVLITCAVLALAQVLVPWLAALLIGVCLLAVAGVTALLGRGALRRALPPVPGWAATSVRQDMAAIARGATRR